MKLNNKGVTMMELLGAMVILGILFGLAVPAITTVINDTRNKTYVNDAMKLISNAEYSLRKDNKIPKPTTDRCVLMTMVYLDNGVFDEGPYGGSYEKNMSYVVVKKEGNKDVYYVRIVERLKVGSYRGIDLRKDSDLLKDRSFKTMVTNINDDYKINYILTHPDPYKTPEETIIGKFSGKISGCSTLSIYAPNSSD